MSRKGTNAEQGLYGISLSYNVVQDFGSITEIIICKAYLKNTFVLLCYIT